MKQNLCIECQRPTSGRKRHCNRCALRRTRQHWVGSECECCGDSRRVVLVRRELATMLDEIGRACDKTVVTLCGSCSVILGRQTMTLGMLRAELDRYTQQAS
jgi:hypothetical protein